MVRFGVIGCGSISSVFMDAVKQLDNAAVTRVFDANASRAESFAARNGAIPCASMDALLAAEDVDAVYICTPSGLHADCAVRAAGAGKHIVVEKPMGVSTEQLDSIQKACEGSGVKLCAVSQLYFSDAYQRVKRAVESGGFGKVFLADLSMKYFRSDEYYQSGGWRGTWALDGGGALMNQGIHGVGLLLGLMGRPKSVTALARTFVHPIEVEDTAAVLVEFQSGAVASIIAATSVQPGKPRVLTVHGTKGTVSLTEDRITEWSVGGKTPPVTDDGPIRSSASNPADISCELHRRQLADFIRAVETNARPVLGVAEGRMPVDLILAVYRSSQSGKTVYFEEGKRKGRQKP